MKNSNYQLRFVSVPFIYFVHDDLIHFSRCEVAHSLRYTFGVMAVMVEMHHTGSEPGSRAEIAAVIEHALSDRPGYWKVSIIGSQANDRWEMKINGPNAFERSYALERTAGEHEAQVIGSLVAKMVPRRA